MAFPQIKRRFSLFGSSPPPKIPPVNSPTLTPQNLINTTTSQDVRKDNKPTSNDIRKSIENLEKLVLAADEYRNCLNRLSKFSKNFSKCLKDYGSCREIDKSNAQCLQFTAQFYENYAEIQTKLNKALRKEFDTLQKFWDKYSKKVTKDEKAHEDYVGDLDKQIKKITKDYEKKSKKENKLALESHDKYTASLTSINSDIARARAEYAEEVIRREKHTHFVASQIVCRLIGGQYASFNDSLKKCGPCITKIKEWAPFAGQNLSPILDLDIFLEMQNMTMPPENNHDNSINEELIYSGNKRKCPNKMSRSIASILEVQRAAMNNRSQENVTSITEESENTNTSKESLHSNCKSQFAISVETTTTTTTTVINDFSECEKLASSKPPIVTATTEINPPISSKNVPNSKEKSSTKNTPNLLSSLSIGIHDHDSPFLRSGSNIDTISSDMTTKKNLMTQETKSIETNSSEKDSIKIEDNHIVSLTPPPVYNKSRDIIKNNNNRMSNKIKNSEEINISSPVPIGNTFRISFIENNENGGRKSSLNEYKEDHQAMDCTGTIKDSDVHVCTRVSESPTPSFDTETLVRSFPIDLPSRSIPQTPSNSPKDGSGRYDPIIDIIDNHHSDSSRYSKNSGSFHSPLPDNKRMSVADIRERLLSLNTNERRLSTQSVRDFPKPRQGYVNEVKSKFGETSNSRSNSDTIVISKSKGDHRDDMYPEHSEETNSNKSTINEQCNCHNCREIRRAMTIDDINHNHHPKDSFLPEDDLTFGRINY